MLEIQNIIERKLFVVVETEEEVGGIEKYTLEPSSVPVSFQSKKIL